MKINITVRDFVNATFFTRNGRIQSVNGTLEVPNDHFNAKELKKFLAKTGGNVVDGVAVAEANATVVTDERAKKSWTSEKILEFAADKNISIPDDMTTNAKKVEFINLVLDKIEAKKNTEE